MLDPKYLLISFGCTALMFLGCAQEDHPAPETHSVHWGYEGDTGPAAWASLDESFATCGSGVEQSPIDLTDATIVSESLMERNLGRTALTLTQRARVMDIVDNGHTIQVTNDIPMTVELDGADYELVQYHFHAPSEHTIDGLHTPLEAHFVHKSAVGDFFAFSILVEEGAHDPIWDVVLAELPDGPGDDRHIDGLEFDVEKFRPLPDRYYRYEGSLTTPPCSENVHWVVMAEKRQISEEQMTAIVSQLHNNNRPVQPIGERALRLVSDQESPLPP
jgi:carbonic anhydrase